MSAMFPGKKLEDQKEPATLLHSVDMETGEEGYVLAATILVNELNENYPNASYVGKGFEIIITRDAAKKYNHVALCEVALPEGFVPPGSVVAVEHTDESASSTSKPRRR